MKKTFRIIVIILIVLLIICQFIPVEKPENRPVEGKDIFSSETVPENVSTLLKTACFNCHSEETRYPWYVHVAPSSWLLYNDVHHGRKHLNFSFWKDLSKKEKIKKLDGISDEVGQGDMPLKIYLIMHPEARLTDDQRHLIVNWADSLSDAQFE